MGLRTLSILYNLTLRKAGAVPRTDDPAYAVKKKGEHHLLPPSSVLSRAPND